MGSGRVLECVWKLLLLSVSSSYQTSLQNYSLFSTSQSSLSPLTLSVPPTPSLILFNLRNSTHPSFSLSTAPASIQSPHHCLLVNPNFIFPSRQTHSSVPLLPPSLILRPPTFGSILIQSSESLWKFQNFYQPIQRFQPCTRPTPSPAVFPLTAVNHPKRIPSFTSPFVYPADPTKTFQKLKSH